MWRSIATRLSAHVLKALAYGIAGVALTLLVVFVVYLENRPDLEPWHRAHLDEEFTEHKRVATFEEYLALEDRVFKELDRDVYAKTETAGERDINRYRHGSLADPGRWPRNWNRTFELPLTAPRAKVLLLHGLSDSPYSLRLLAEHLHEAGAWALALRIPGHGTAPAGLVRVRWQDMAAAVRLAIRHLAQVGGDAPLYIVGYSNGAALAVNYALESLDDESLPRVAGLVLISPEIGVSPAAAIGIWQARLGRVLGLEKLAWNDIALEYDPFKYNSFAINAVDASYRITREIQRRLDRLASSRRLTDVPKILAFSSVVDATVLVPALVGNLFNRLPENGHELVLFDINRVAGTEPLLRWTPDALLDALEHRPSRAYGLSVLTNVNSSSRRTQIVAFAPRSSEGVRSGLALEWPADVFSLSHVALPFAPEDPLYGGRPAQPSPGVHLGDIALRGERGVLRVSPGAMLRLRWNPFYPYLEARTVGFLGLDPGTHRTAD